MSYVITKLREPSSWAGIAALFAALGWQLPTEYFGAITQVGIALAGLAAILLNERKP
jgi:hypothetical protein